MGKNARKSRQEMQRAAAQVATTNAVKKKYRTIAWTTMGAIGIAVIVLVSLSSGGKGSALPRGTLVFSEKDHQHVAGSVKYDHTPPAGGAHNAEWLNCGIYTRPVPNTNAVHDLEHGAVWITYRPSVSPLAIAELQQFVTNHYDGPQRYLTLSPYSGLPAPVVASAWGAQIRLTSPNDPRLAEFVAHFVGGNQGGEQGAPCTGGIGSPVA